ncbi:hypothetical protein PIB30_060024 [Stylosanthes scabra]|uniref:Reverse transcriptase domain-containing protein n=1 Tax=Stylosanthes scabra TaxID=79078 RepID=A0ABU6ZJ69_9FABA|nr:hypothetical protein [Stylosanthes scabra]
MDKYITLGTTNGKPDPEASQNHQASITEIYHQVLEKGVLPKARPLKGRTQNAKNISLFCDYHQGYGHKTQDCYDLKDAIEQAIRDDKLNEFIQIIREPRTSEKERSIRLEPRNPRNRRDDNEPIMEIPVITGSSAMEKSKSAIKKDLKILATVRTPPPQFSTITFGREDFVHGLADSDSPMVISAKLGPGLVMRENLCSEFKSSKSGLCSM